MPLMKKLILFYWFLVACLTVQAQEVKTGTVSVTDNPQQELSAPGMAVNDSIVDVVSNLQSFYEPLSAQEMFAVYRQSEVLHLPELNTHGQVMRHTMPYFWGGWQSWDLHPGLNVSLGASVFAMFGKHVPHGAGFGQNAAVMYALPLSNRLTLAVGGYFSNLTWSHQSYQNAGISAVLGYRFDEHWEGFIYGQKSVARSERYPLPLYDLSNAGDRIGAGVRYNFNPTFWIEVSFEASKYDVPNHFTHPQKKFEYKR